MISKRCAICVVLFMAVGCNNDFVFGDFSDDGPADSDGTEPSSNGETDSREKDGTGMDTETGPDATTDRDTDTDTDSESSSSENNDTEPNDTSVLFESGFEYGLPGEADTDGEISVETTTVRSGQYSMRAAVSSEETSAAVEASFPPVSEGSLYFRAYYYISDPPDSDTINIMEVRDPDWNDLFDINLNSSLGFNMYFFADEAAFFSDSGIVQAGEWFCLTARLTISDVSGGAEVWVDGEAAVSSEGTVNFSAEGGISIMRVGIMYSYPESGDVEIFVDDVVLSTAPVDC